MTRQTLNGFPDYTWKYIAQFTDLLYTNFARQDSSGLRLVVGYLEEVVGENKKFRPNKKDENRSFKHWYGMIADGFHKRDMDLVRYSVAGMRTVVDEFFQKDLLWQRHQGRAA